MPDEPEWEPVPLRAARPAPTLARSAARAARADAPGTGFEIVHLTAAPTRPLKAPISPGVYPPLEWDDGDTSEVLSMTLLGAGVALRTSFLGPGPGPNRPVEFSQPPDEPERSGLQTMGQRLRSLRPATGSPEPGLAPLVLRVRGSAQANPSFLFGSARILEVMLDQRGPASADGTDLVPWWTRRDQLTDVLAGLTGACAAMRVPVLFLHSSLSLPPDQQGPPGAPRANTEPAAETGHVIRLGIGLPDALAGRVALLEKLCRLAQAGHYGLSVSDRSAGAPRGLWRRLLAAPARPPAPVQAPAGPLRLMTVVAPATVGVIRALVRLIHGAGLGIHAIGAETMQEVAFISVLFGTGRTAGPGPETDATPETIMLTSGSERSGREVLTEYFPAAGVGGSLPSGAGPDPLAEAAVIVTQPIAADRMPVAAGGFVLWIGWEVVDQPGARHPGATAPVLTGAVGLIVGALLANCPPGLEEDDWELTVVYARARRATHLEARGRVKVVVTHPALAGLNGPARHDLFAGWCRDAQRQARQNLIAVLDRPGTSSAAGPGRAEQAGQPQLLPDTWLGASQLAWGATASDSEPAVQVRVSWLEPWLGWPAGSDV